MREPDLTKKKNFSVAILASEPFLEVSAVYRPVIAKVLCWGDAIPMRIALMVYGTTNFASWVGGSAVS